MEFTSSELSLIQAAVSTTHKSLEFTKSALHINRLIDEKLHKEISDTLDKYKKLLIKISKGRYRKGEPEFMDDNALLEELMHRASSELKTSDAGISSNIDCTEMRFRDKKTFDVMSKMFTELFYSTKIRTGKYDEDDEVEEPGAYYIRFV